MKNKMLSIKEMIDYRVKTSPHKECLCFENKTLSYIEFANIVKNNAQILKEQGIKKGMIVAVCLSNSIELIVYIYAILYLGGVVFPFDVEIPEERIKTLVNGVPIGAFISDKSTLAKIENLGYKTILADCIDIFENNISMLEDTFEQNFGIDDVAFCMSTSGSLGLPKVTLLRYKGIYNHAYEKERLLGIGEKSRVCLSFSVNFVASIWQFLSPILMGATLMIYRRDLFRKPYMLFEQIDRDCLSVISVLPQTLSLYLNFIDSGKDKLKFEKLENILLTGERLEAYIVKKFYKLYDHVTLINAYGQTECSDDTYHYVIPQDFSKDFVPIGVPISNMYGFVLNDKYEEGDAGELYIGGIGVTDGYLNNQNLSKESFVRLDFFQETLYRTGDMVEKNLDGTLTYIGRKDNQIKIRGHRIELEEVRAVINAIDGVANSIVHSVKSNIGIEYLEALIFTDYDISLKKTRSILLEKLPDYMVPTKLFKINGDYIYDKKVDKSELFKIQYEREKEENDAFLESLSQNEKVILKVICGVLQEEGLFIMSMEDEIEDLGIDSILFVKIIISLEEEFGFDFEIGFLITDSFRTIGDLVRYVTEKIKKKIGNIIDQ